MSPAQPHLFLLAGQYPGTTHAQTLAAAREYALAGEAARYAGVWIAEHHFIPYGTCPSALAFAAHLLGATSRITVGTAACVLSNRHPVALAEEAVLLDELSDGRFALGVGRGGPWVDLEVFGTGLDRYTDGFAASVDLLTAWLSGAERVAGNAHFPFRPVPVVPRPRRPVPTWIAATSAGTVDLAARHGLPLLLGLHASVTEKSELLDRYHHTAARHGHDPSTVEHASAHLAHVADTDETARSAVRANLPALLRGVDDYVRIDGAPPARRDHHRYVEKLLRIHPVGAPAYCRERLAEATALTGVRHLLLMVEAGGGRAATLDNIARLAADVLRPTAGPRPPATPPFSVQPSPRP
ncbi:LLM class flavin-dependent oxidoreductase [Micromonospora sp. NPDC050397]|uniref:LLM class flavin-dependent oxidoreductase n=1 Tax=Micromonospora sp. NPDC050397 TaxID=3364279 RepID=UPI003851203C